MADQVFDEVEIRCARCDYQMPHVEDPLMATVTFATGRQPAVLIGSRLGGHESQFWNAFKVGDGPDLARGGVLWDKPTFVGEAVVLPCRRCHSAAKVKKARLIAEARGAIKKGSRRLLVNPSGVIRVHRAAVTSGSVEGSTGR